MKLDELLAHFAIITKERPKEMGELLRAVRQGTPDLVGEERRLARAAAAAGHPYDWQGYKFASLLYGKSGRYGGVVPSPQAFGHFLIGYLTDAPRTAVAEVTLALAYANIRERALCGLTRKHHFGEAVAALLSDKSLLRRVGDVGVSGTLQMAHIDFDNGGRSLFATPVYDATPKSVHKVKHVYPELLLPLLGFLAPNEPVSAPHKRALAEG